MRLFNKKTDSACRHCQYALVGEQYITCTKKRKYVQPDGKCFRFRYDPLKRVPFKQKAPDFSGFDPSDFTL